MARFLLLMCVAAIALVGCGSRASRTSLPSGLTQHGQIVWNLDALLHATFASRAVYVDYGREDQIPVFSTHFISNAQSSYYVYTFASARDSRFHVVLPEHPPRRLTGATGGEVPLMIGRGYISCGSGLWLYSRWGQSIPDGDLSCWKRPGS